MCVCVCWNADFLFFFACFSVISRCIRARYRHTRLIGSLTLSPRDSTELGKAIKWLWKTEVSYLVRNLMEMSFSLSESSPLVKVSLIVWVVVSTKMVFSVKCCNIFRRPNASLTSYSKMVEWFKGRHNLYRPPPSLLTLPHLLLRPKAPRGQYQEPESSGKHE